MLNSKENKMIYRFNKEGKYDFTFKFKNNNTTNLYGLFEDCKEIIYLNLSNLILLK